jgi:deazaflavin-dependent oxidoreductase (nitroreductase family)
MASETPFTETRRFKVMRTVIGALNPLMVRLLGSRFAGPMAKNLMLLRFIGRTSGRTYTTPVGYVRDGDRVVVVTSPTYRWWRNVRDGAAVQVRLDGVWRDGHARVVPATDPGHDEAVALQVRGRGPGMLRGFGVPVDDHGHVPEAARAGLDEKALIVVIELAPVPVAAEP